MKDKLKKRVGKKNNAKSERKNKWICILNVLLCIFIAVIVCSSCALIQVIRLKRQLWVDVEHLTDDFDKVRIYIDQGHNPTKYHNSGAVGNDLYEQDLTFSIGCMLAERLTEDGRFEVCLSRPDEDTVLGTDTNSSLNARVEGAKEFEADYFISLHINSFTDESVNGIEVFALENDEEAYAFGEYVLSGMVDSTSLKSRGMKQSADLYVLKNSDMPAVLLEMGFISNVNDAKLLSEQPEMFVKGIYDGMVDYFESAYSLDIAILLCIICISTALIIPTAIGLVITIKRKRNIERTCQD